MVSRPSPRLRPRRSEAGPAGRWRRPVRGGSGAARFARYVAPVAFLLAVTGVVLLVRSSLRPHSSAGTTVTAPAAKHAPARSRAPRTARPAQYYVIASGDTLGAIAGRFSTTVNELLRLNPGVEPTALRPGKQLRIR